MKLKYLSTLSCVIFFLAFKIQETACFADTAFDIARYVEGNKQTDKDRAGYVKSLLQAAGRTLTKPYNIMIFNLGEDYVENLSGVKFYSSHVFPGDGTTFGLWIFEHGTFENRGGRGWKNWGFMGRFTRNRKGNKVYFKKR